MFNKISKNLGFFPLSKPTPQNFLELKKSRFQEFIAEFNATHKHISSAQKQAEAEKVVVEEEESAMAMEHEDQ